MTDTIRHNPDNAWHERALLAAEGTMTGAILRAALGTPIARLPRFGFKAIITSDGFVMADYTDSMGVKHMGAFVGAVAHIVANMEGLAAHLSLNDRDREAMYRVIDGWIARDYRSAKRASLFGGSHA